MGNQRPDSIFRLWRSIKHLLTYLLTYVYLQMAFNLTQHVNFSTHNRNHILDLVITSSDSSLAPYLSVTHCSPSDHFPIFTKLSVELDRTPPPPPTSHSFRRYHSIDIDSCLADLQCSRLITNPPITRLSPDCLQHHSVFST